MGQKRFKEARLLLEEMLRTEPGNILANYQLGLLERQRGNSEKSQQYLEKASGLLKELKSETIVWGSSEMMVEQLQDLINSAMQEE